MGTLSLGSVQVEADRLRADRRAIGPILEVFRKHPRAQWSTMLAELYIALDSEPAAVTPSVHKEPGQTDATNGKAAAPPSPSTFALSPPKAKRDYSDIVIEMLTAAGAVGVSPVQLATTVYGDEKATEKVRAIVWHLVTKRKMAIEKREGRWRLTGAAPETVTIGARGKAAPSSVKPTSLRGLVLAFLSEKGVPVSIEDVQGGVDEDPGKVTRAIYDMSAARHGWVARGPDGWKITPAGRALLP
jgi:hypothetical protein